MGIFNAIANAIPEIKGPSTQLSFKAKLGYAVLGVAIFAALYLLYPFGTNNPQNSFFWVWQLGSTGLASAGLTSIIIISFLTMLYAGASRLKTDFTKPEEKVMFQRRVKLAMIIFAIAIASVLPVIDQSTMQMYPVVFIQLLIAGLAVIYLDELLYKYSFTSGINLFILAAFAIQFIIIFAVQTGSAASCIGNGGAASISCAGLQYVPLIALAAIFWITLKVIRRYGPANESAHRLAHGIGARFPLNFLSVSFFAVYSYTFMLRIIDSILNAIASALGSSSYLGQFIALQSAGVLGSTYLVGGIRYLISAIWPISYSVGLGGLGDYNSYLLYMASSSSRLVLPNGSAVMIPEWAHVAVYAVVALVIVLIATKVWTRLSDRNIEHGIAQHKRQILEQSVILWLLFMLENAGFSVVLGSITIAFISYYVYLAAKESRMHKA